MLILQFILMIFVFPYDSPTELKARGETKILHEMMGRLYHKDHIERRIAQLNSDEPEKGDGTES